MLSVPPSYKPNYLPCTRLELGWSSNLCKAPISEILEIDHRTSDRWLKDSALRGSNAYRTKRSASKQLGRPPKHPLERYLDLTSPSKNPVRKQSLRFQIAYHYLDINDRTLQKHLLEDADVAQMYKQVPIKEIWPHNRRRRVNHGYSHKDASIHGFWDRIVRTDRAHFNLSDFGTGRVLWQQWTRYKRKNF